MNNNHSSNKQRIDVPGACYYLPLKGSGQRQVITERGECLQLLRLLDQLCRESGAQVLGYCLLEDSVHLVLLAPADGGQNCVQLGQWLVSEYSRFYNEHHRHGGSVFHDHLTPLLIDPTHYLLPVIYKLHRLPVTLGLVPQPAAYPWSSHRDYLSPEPPAWLNRGEVLRRVAGHRAMQLRRYELLMEENTLEDVDWISGNHPQYRALASEEYIQRVAHTRRPTQNYSGVDLHALTQWVCGEYGLSTQDMALWRRHRLIHEVRAMVAALASRLHCASRNQVATFFGCEADMLDTGIRALESQRGMYLYRLQLQIERELIAELEQIDNKQGEEDTRDNWHETATDSFNDIENIDNTLEQHSVDFAGQIDPGHRGAVGHGL